MLHFWYFIHLFPEQKVWMVRIREHLYVSADLAVTEVEFPGGDYVLFTFVLVGENLYHEVIHFGNTFCYPSLTANLKTEYKQPIHDKICSCYYEGK